MEERNAQNMLDLSIHDYLVKKNLHKVADILAQEANIEPKTLATNPSEGFLPEWWSLFCDVYYSTTGINPSTEQASISMTQLPQTSVSVPQNVPTVLPETDVNYMLCPPMAPPRVSNTTAVSMPEMGSLVPPRILDPTLNAHNVEQYARMQPSSSKSGSRKKRVNKKRQIPQSQGNNLGATLKKPTTSVLAPPVPKFILGIPAERADAGSSASSKSSCPDAKSRSKNSSCA